MIMVTIKMRIVYNGKYSKLKECFRSHITRRKKHNSKPSCAPGTVVENTAKVRRIDGRYFHSVHELHVLNEQRE